MKKFLLLIISFFAFSTVNSQMLEPAKWTTKVEKLSETEFNLIINGTIDDGWHVYTQFTPDGGPIAMKLIFKNQNANYQLIGNAKESKFKKEFSEIFEIDEYFFEKSATITQRIKIINPKTNNISLRFEYQVCKEACINDVKNFVFNIPAISNAVLPVKVDSTLIVPISNEVLTTSIDTTKNETVLSKGTQEITKELEDDKKGLWTIFLLAFLGGLAALLTPCVFPMIPMTVSFFTKQSKTKAQGQKNAIIYGLSIIAIYVVLGLAVTGIFGADALNKLSTNVWFNLIFFFLLVVFAASFLGAFEIMLPNSWANKIDRQADRGGIIGILFMALALAIVSFSCTGPIVGTLLVESATKGGIAPVVGMLGFSSALALPFMLFAMFPSWLNSLPKSGGWLNTVKVSLGFLELAFAFKFLSNADLVLQLHILERETFLAIWIAVFGAWAVYLFGKFKLPHDSDLKFISVGRLFLALLVSAFTIYMIPGLFGAPLKLISAFPPSQTYSESPKGFFGNSESTSNEKLPEGAKYGEHNIVTFTDYKKGYAYAKLVKKPILLDFTGFACVNCRKMEINVWSDEQVLKILKNDVVLISLYVDDNRELPKEEQYISKSTGNEVVTIGNKWSDFIITRYKTNSQPYYVLIDLKENNLNKAVGYTPNIQEYKAWLKDGISKFKR
ncbi:cytochrome c biogenesis protein CcdA [Flavobacterium sp.]|uniref:protein-disulfide reductase DsbD family protein n=1 Tax=Flavobacterium sp. TaxID=239 RepID=UPI0037528ECB